MTPRAHGGLSLRSRVLVGLGTIAAVVLATAVAVTAVTHTYLVSQLDDRLASSSGPVFGEREDPRVPDEENEPREIARPSDVFRGVVEPSGRFLVFYEPNVANAPDAVPDLSGVTLPTSGSEYFTVPSASGESEYRVLAKAVWNGTDVTAISLEDVEQATERLIVIELLGIVFVFAGLAAVGWWVIRLGVNPMRRMVDASSRIADGDLDVRLEGAGHGSESAELATSLNAMIRTLTDALAEKERSSARLREFVADASHELRSPLTTVLGYAELYRRGAIRKDEDVADAWARTEAEASRMRRLVQDMLELAKYDAEPQLVLTDVDLTRLCAEVIRDAEAAHGDVHFALAAADADDSAPAAVRADADRLRQAVINVVTNAAAHGGSRVTVAAVATATGARVTVTDDGPGMPQEMAARATERFVRGDQSRHRATGGAGLGLAITSAIVGAHHGTLAIDSAEGVGTTVTIDLPRDG